MRFALVAFVALAVTLPALAGPSATISDSSMRAGAKPVTLKYGMPAELQCGHPRASTVTLAFPRAMTIPAAIPATAVLVEGKRAGSVVKQGSKVVVGITKPSGIQCDVISQGWLTVVVREQAGLGNPKAPGVYAFAVTVDTETTTAKLRLG